MTTLAQTSASVARNSHLSDWSFRAILSRPDVACERRLKCRDVDRNIGRTPLGVRPLATACVASGQQSSAGRGTGTPASQTGVACAPSDRLPIAANRLTTAHCSSRPLGRSASPQPYAARHQLRHLLLELPAALRVVREHVEARARRRQQHHAVRPRQVAAPRAPRRAIDAASTTGTTSVSASRTSGRASPIATTARPCARERRRADRRSRRPCNLPPTIATTSSKLSIERAAASTLVAFESLTKRTPPIVGDRLHHVLEAGEAVERRAPSPPADAPARWLIARRRDDVAQHVAARAARTAAERHQRHVAFRRALPHDAVARRRRRARAARVDA